MKVESMRKQIDGDPSRFIRSKARAQIPRSVFDEVYDVVFGPVIDVMYELRLPVYRRVIDDE